MKVRFVTQRVQALQVGSLIIRGNQLAYVIMAVVGIIAVTVGWV